ncbi:MAG: preprotein translocase subunit SecY [Planctomycetes bacterium]|nr:preprotein translocase subunit SecY [Planctomycetota bacterium]
MGRIKEVLVNMWSIPELRKRILFTLGILALFQLGSLIPLPGVNESAIREWIKGIESQQGRVFGFLSIFSGGAIQYFSLFTLGIMPYISTSIIFQLLTKVYAPLEALAKEGPSGYRKISQYTRLATVPVALLQSIITVNWVAGQSLGANTPLVANPGILAFKIPAILALLAGSMFVMWIGEQISEYGIGNGASIIIMCGIIGRMPEPIFQLMQNTETVGLQNILIVAALYVCVVIGIVLTTQAQRRIPIQQARHMRGNRMMGGQRTYLPLRVNQAGVMPVIFASSLMVLPQLFGNLVGSDAISGMFVHGSFWYSVLYVGLVFFFTYFWTALYFQPQEMANQLKEYGSFVPGIRPGKKTEEHLERIMNRVTLGGAAFLATIALLPDVVTESMGGLISRSITSFLGGTGILIVVGVALDMMQKIESQMMARQYTGFLRKGRIRGRR